jgi:hypothetical protein
LAEALVALEAELRLHISSAVAGDCAVIIDLPAARGPEAPVVTLGVAVEGDATDADEPGVSPYPSSEGAIAVEADSATTAPEDLVVSMPAAGVMPTFETQNEGFDAGAPHRGDCDVENGGAGA